MLLDDLGREGQGAVVTNTPVTGSRVVRGTCDHRRGAEKCWGDRQWSPEMLGTRHTEQKYTLNGKSYLMSNRWEEMFTTRHVAGDKDSSSGHQCSHFVDVSDHIHADQRH